MPLERLLEDVQHLAVGRDRRSRGRTSDSRCLIASSADRRTSSSESVLNPLVVGRSAYGSSSQAPREPSAPSIARLMRAHREPLVAVVHDAVLRHVGGELVWRFAQHHPDAQRQLALVHDLLHQLDRRRRRAGVVHRGQPLRQALLRRQLDHLAQVRFHLRRRPRRAVAGERIADDRLRPLVEQTGRVAVRVLQDLSARRIRRRLRRTSAIFIASALAKPAWPLACVSHTGLLRRRAAQARRAAESPRRSATAPRDHFSWCQPRPRIHSPGLAFFAASPTIRTMSSQFLAVASFRLRAASPTPVKCDVRVDEARRRQRALQIDHLVAGPM